VTSKSPARETLIPKLERALEGFSSKIRAVVGLIADHDFGGSEWLGEPLTGLHITSDEFVFAKTATNTDVPIGKFEPILQNIAMVLDAAGADASEGDEFARRYFASVVDERTLEPERPEPPEPPRQWQPDDELPRKDHATIVIEKVGDEEFLVGFPNGELIISASKWDAQTAAKEFNHARAKALGGHGIRIDWRNC
jgi:hypothetical protein